MMLKRNSSPSQRSAWTLLRAGLAGLAVMVGGAAVTGCCLDRPVEPAVPRTSNVYVDEIRQTAVDKIDLLFMIDNSISMADKQAILAKAVPLLVQRLITPICVRPCAEADNCSEAQARDGIPVGGNAPDCPNGSAPEFSPIKDIHVGVVTSSLGSHGAVGSGDVCTKPSDNDHAQLLGSIRTAAPNGNPLVPYDGNGFLKWDTTDPPKYTPKGEANGSAFIAKFTDMVASSGEGGCGFEASLESWYRFLIDPEPPESIVLTDGLTAPVGIDQKILAQRAAFLRPDSLVAIIMLSDENDCSIVDEGYGHLIARAPRNDAGPFMFRSTSQCLSNPNDGCCQSCGESAARAGCPAIAEDVECKKGQTYKTRAEDATNLRCWQQKRRFGFDLLYSTERYSGGLRNRVVPSRDPNTNFAAPNPLYVGGRDEGLVFLAGIVGVPWQDIADADTLGTPDTLRYMTATELDAAGRWDVILGTSNTGVTEAPIPPSDPLMLETPEPRTGTNPIINAPLVSADSTNPTANPINGHEQKNMGSNDLQYACIFPLANPVQCTPEREAALGGCDCYTGELGYNRPLCQPPGGGAPTITQHFAKAYPGTRHLQVLREYKANSIVASICPKVAIDETKTDFGYNPAVKAIIDRLKEALKGKCLPRPLVPNAVGQVPCAVVEAVPPTGAACDCSTLPNRASVADRPELRDAVLSKLRTSKTCDTQGQPACADFCTCEIKQFEGEALTACQTQIGDPETSGYCYINAAPNEPNVGNKDLVKDCSANSKRLLRFGDGSPTDGGIALVACLGASLGSQTADP